MAISAHTASYLSAVSKDLTNGLATEHTHRPALKQYLEALASQVTATNEPKRVACGAPDFVVTQPSAHGPRTIGYVECKEVGASLGISERSAQLVRYKSALANLLLTDYLEFRWYVDGVLRGTASLGSLAPDGKTIAPGLFPEEVENLLAGFVHRAAAPVTDALDLATRMARLTRLIHDLVLEAFRTKAASPLLKDLRAAFEDVLLPGLRAEQFADMFAQTLSYGLFVARANHDTTKPFSRGNAAREVPRTNPFLRKLFDQLSGAALDDEPFVDFVDDLEQLLADADMVKIMKSFGSVGRRTDPVIHFYESFLAAYDPEQRELRGVYYTPEPVVHFIVESVDEVLRTDFACADGLADTSKTTYSVYDAESQTQVTKTSHRVLILDPACGTGTFLYTVIDQIREGFRQRKQAGVWCGYVQQHLLPRLFGFELLVAPYAVAHMKLSLQLAARPAARRALPMGLYEHYGASRDLSNERSRPSSAS